MSKKKDIWDQIRKSLASELSKSEFETWFSQVSLKQLKPRLAIIQVPNKFVASWLRDKYQNKIKKSFEHFLKQAPELHFTYDHSPSNWQPAHLEPSKKSDPHLQHNLDVSKTFQSFYRATCNRFACSSALQVANSPTEQYNPLYIFSQWGLGKTHLLNAIGNHVLSENPLSRVRYLSSNGFTSDFTFAIRNRKVDQFRDRYRNLDLLLFDDVQFLGTRKRTQEEFFSIFNALYAEQKQIVVTGDRPPNQLTKMDSRLKSRLGGGIISELEVPDQNTKVDFAKKKLKEDNMDVEDDVIFFLAKSNRDIKGLMNNIVRIKTYLSLNGGDINITAVKSLIKEKHRREVEIEDVKSITAGYFNIPLSKLISNKKQRIYSYPRQLAMYLSRKHTGLSFKQIGDLFGSKDHSTVVYAVKRIEKYREQKKEIREDLKKIENLLA
jgi:chromosomal replication initiator protein